MRKHMNKLKLIIVFVHKRMHARFFSMATALCRHSWGGLAEIPSNSAVSSYLGMSMISKTSGPKPLLTKLFLQLALIHISIIDINAQD